MKKALTFLFFVVTTYVTSQNINYARQVLDTLCSSHFDGRGYYNNGEKRAANYIKNQFESLGLKPIGNSFLQKFNLSVNTITGNPKVCADDKVFKAGEEFLIAPSSKTFKGKGQLFYLTKTALTNFGAFKKVIPELKNKFVVVDKTLLKNENWKVKREVGGLIEFLKFSSEIKLKGVVELVEKLTYTASQEVALRSHIIIKSDVFNRGAKTIKLDYVNHFDANYQSQNVIACIEGEQKNNYVFVVGHYDHLGRMGDDVYFPGANDNASGIAMLLSLAKEFSKEKKPKKSIVFIAFGSEEIGLVGSKYYTENPLVPLENIDFLINLDILGTGDDGIQVVNGSKYKEEFDKLVSINASEDLLKQVKIRGEACNSDHCFFNEKGVPSFFIYTLGGVAHYHDVYDKSETLPLTEFEDLFTLLKDFIQNQ